MNAQFAVSSFGMPTDRSETSQGWHRYIPRGCLRSWLAERGEQPIHDEDIFEHPQGATVPQ